MSKEQCTSLPQQFNYLPVIRSEWSVAQGQSDEEVTISIIFFSFDKTLLSLAFKNSFENTSFLIYPKKHTFVDLIHIEIARNLRRGVLVKVGHLGFPFLGKAFDLFAVFEKDHGGHVF